MHTPLQDEHLISLTKNYILTLAMMCHYKNEHPHTKNCTLSIDAQMVFYIWNLHGTVLLLSHCMEDTSQQTPWKTSLRLMLFCLSAKENSHRQAVVIPKNY